MLINSDTPIAPVLEKFTSIGIGVSFLVPTETGMEKSIMDAIAPFRDYLASEKVHDFSTQQQGQDNKVILEAFFVYENEIKQTQVSLYRPTTKEGDPRIWFYRLNQYAKPFNLLAIFCISRILYVVNASNSRILKSLDFTDSPLGKLVRKYHEDKFPEAEELLDRLLGVSSKGFIKSPDKGDTAVGATLLRELDIPVYDMSKGPDFKGIEIKAHRIKRGGISRQNRVTLFSQTPDWRLSRCKNGKQILDRFGYFSEKRKRKQLYVTVRANHPNSQGLYFKVDFLDDFLDNLAMTADGEIEPVVRWDLSELRKRLLEKHTQSFFVGAECKTVKDVEYFHYVDVEITQKPIASNLSYLIDEGYITMDYTLSEKSSGGTRDHGYLFKMLQSDFHYLLPRVRKIDLTSYL